MGYDKKSFAAGIAVGRQLKGWSVGGGGGSGPEPTGNIDIFLNGDYNVADYATAHVQVGSGASGIIFGNDYQDLGNWGITQTASEINGATGWLATAQAIAHAFVAAFQQTSIGAPAAFTYEKKTSANYTGRIYVNDSFYMEFTSKASGVKVTVVTSTGTVLVDYNYNTYDTAPGAGTTITVWIREFSSAILRWGWTSSDGFSESKTCLLRMRGLLTDTYILGSLGSNASNPTYYSFHTAINDVYYRVGLYLYGPEYVSKTVPGFWYAIPAYGLIDNVSFNDYFVFSDGNAIYALPAAVSVGVPQTGSYRQISFGGKRFIIPFGSPASGDGVKWGAPGVYIGDVEPSSGGAN